MEMGSASVLVVDDGSASRPPLADWLSQAGFRVLRAKSGAAALARLEAGGIDLVMLDVRLPDVSGFDICERIKGDPAHAALPVIHVSTRPANGADRAQSLARGGDAYLATPKEPEEVVATVQAVLRYYRARQRAERLAARLSRLADTTLAVNSAATFTELLTAAVAGAARMYEAPAVVVAESADGESLAGVTAGPDKQVEVSPWRLSFADLPVGVSMRTEPAENWPLVAWPDGEMVAVAIARLRDDRPPLCVAVPASGPMPGVPVLIQLAQVVAVAAEAQRTFDEEHRIALTLQRSLLPKRIPDVPGVDLAVRYEPASVRTEVGGDFYELVMLDGELLVAIGDVAGHSLHAATVMGELRHAVRAYAVEGHRPSAVLSQANDMMRTLLPGELATICVLLLHPPTGRIRMASAGHLPPLVVSNGEVQLVEHPAPLLGVRADRPADLEFVLPAGATLLLYTDGLVERRDADIDEGIRALAQAAAKVDSDLDQFCERLLAELAPPDISDDVAVLALRRR